MKEQGVRIFKESWRVERLYRNHPADNGNIAAEIIRNTIHAGTQDPRFYPVEEGELDQLIYSVDVLKDLAD